MKGRNKAGRCTRDWW